MNPLTRIRERFEMNGSKKWYFADGYLEIGGAKGKNSHEALCILNANEREARIRIQFFFSDRDPITFYVSVPPLRDIHIRLDSMGLSYETPYGIKVDSNVEIVAQLSRMSIHKGRYSLMTTIGYWED